MSINRVTVTGNLTRDVEVKTTQSGTAVANIGIAVNDRRKSQLTGEWEDVPNFFTVVVFGARGEALARHLRKGSKVAVEGKLRYRSWEAQDGSKRSAVEIVADDVEFMDPKPQAAPAQPYQSAPAPAYAPAPPAPAPMPQAAPAAPYAAPQPPQAPAPTVQAHPGAAPQLYDEEIPFD